MASYYSKERIYQSCNLHHHCLAAHLSSPIKIEDKLVDTIYILSVVISDDEKIHLCHNIANNVNTNDGMISIKCFIDKGNPFEPIEISVPLESIYEIESVESK